jgi:predicted peptidase
MKQQKLLKNPFFIVLASLVTTSCQTNPDILFSSSSLYEDSTSLSLNQAASIQEVKAIGTVAIDASKLVGIAIKYDVDLTGAKLDETTFSVKVYDSLRIVYQGDGELGKIERIYINDEANISKTGGKNKGNYVIIELFHDFLCATEPTYNNALSVSVQQLKDIELSSGLKIAPNGKSISNKTSSKNLDFIVSEVSGFQFFCNDEGSYGSDGPSFEVKDCFNQETGTYDDIALDYALYVPSSWKKDGKYALVTIENPAAGIGTHPLEAVLQTRSTAYYATTRQEVIKQNFPSLDGMIVVVPVITSRVNDNGGTPAEYQAVVGLWDYLSSTFSVDTNYIYGSGQSVGGMILLETQRNRDNFFAGLLLYENQWTQNYYIDTIYSRDMATSANSNASASRQYPRIDENITWNYHYGNQGEKVDVASGHDPYNYYYLVSDDNILVLHNDGNNFSGDTWNEMYYLYKDLTGQTINKYDIDANDDLSKQSKELMEDVNEDKNLNINVFNLINGDSSGCSCRRIDSSYEWLLSQTRQEEIDRDKLDINKEFQLADYQVRDETRKLNYTDADGNPLYFVTAKQGSGTRAYNSSWLSTTSVANNKPGWLPEGMSYLNGVNIGNIIGSSKIDEETIAVQYNQQLRNLSINLLGDKVYNIVTKEYRDDDFVIVSPFEFYDSNKKKITNCILKAYLNNQPGKIPYAENKSGEGKYLIL